MDLSIRNATPEDTPIITELAYRIWRAHYTPIIGAEQVAYMLGHYYNDDALRADMAAGQVFWIPEMGGQALGYLSFTPTGPGQYFLNKFYIDNEKRGLGLGKIILERALAQYPDMRELRLNVNRQNYKSINFYFRVGFTIDFCLDTPFGDGYVMDDFQMVLKLGGGA